MGSEGAAQGHEAALTAILAQVSREALQGDGLDEVLQHICDCLVRNLPVAIASIILLDEGGTTFVQEVWSGQLDLTPPAMANGWPVTMGAAGRCARLGTPQLIADVDSDPDYVPGNAAVRSEYLVPIRHRDRLHGVLNIESTRSDLFDDQVRAMFDAIADQVAGAIHLARLAAELEEANRKLEALSMSDGLTGIGNRRLFDRQLAAEWKQMAQDRVAGLQALHELFALDRQQHAVGAGGGGGAARRPVEQAELADQLAGAEHPVAGGAPPMHRDQFDLAALDQPGAIGRIALPVEHLACEQFAPDRHGRLRYHGGMSNELPDRLSLDPRSPHHDAALLERGVGIRFNGTERTNVEEYCISEGWIRVVAGKSLDRRGNPMTMKLKGTVEPYLMDAGSSDGGDAG